jgi:hypothetical protein
MLPGVQRETIKTDLLIIDEGKWEEAKSKASTMPIADFKRSYARFERNNLSNNSLASMVGAGKWQALFKDTTTKSPSLTSSSSSISQ